MKKIFLYAIVIFIGQSLKATTYYVSSTGKDNNSGTSASSPWKSIFKVNSINFLAGDSILFQGGSTFSGSLYFDAADMGSSANPIFISSYGTGKATIKSGIEVGIYFYNTAGYKIKNLNIVGSGRTNNQASGVLFYMDPATTNKRLKYVFIDNIEVSDYRDNGICIGSWYDSNGFDDITIINSSVHDIGYVGIGTYAKSRLGHKNMYVAHNNVFNIAGTGDSTIHSGDGIIIGGVDGATVEYCTVYNNGWLNGQPFSGPNAIWAFQSNNVIIQYSEAFDNKTAYRDGGGFDLDGGCTNSIIQYNYSHDNAGAGYLLCQKSTAYAFTNNIVRYNKSENDGLKNNYGAIQLWSSGVAGGINNAQIYDNEIIDPYTRGVYIASNGIYNTTISNNTFKITNGSYTIISPKNNTTLKFEKNNYGDPSSFKVNWTSKTYNSLKDWRDKVGQENFILREIWYNVSGSTTDLIPVNAVPSAVLYLDNYETPQNLADNYGERISGYIVAPQTGNYTFWIAGDNDCKLYLSTDSLTKNKVKIAGFSGLTNYREWTKYSGQNSSLISLTAGKKYYIEILHKESDNADHVSLKWQLPDGTIEIPVSGGYSSNKAITTNGPIENVKLTTKINEASILTAYPNPLKSYSTVQLISRSSNKANLELYDLQGRRLQRLFTGNIQKGELYKFNVEAKSLTNGIYIIKLITKNEVSALKLFVLK